MRDKKTGAFEPTEELADLTPEEFEFINLLMFDASVNGNASEAYRRAFPNLSHRHNTVWCEASKLKNNSRVRQWISVLKASQMQRLESTREQYIADLNADIEQAKVCGNFGAAATLRVAQGKVLGHLIERSEDVNKTRDQVVSLKYIADTMGIEQAMKIAEQIGMKDNLLQMMAAGNA